MPKPKPKPSSGKPTRTHSRKPKPARGGARPGAGRKPIDPDSRAVQLAITLPPHLAAALDSRARQLGCSRSSLIASILAAELAADLAGNQAD